MQDFLTNIFSYIIAPVASGFAGWFFAKRKIKAEAESGELDNVDKALEIYRKAIKDLEGWKTELLEKMGQIESENQELRKQLRESHSENESLRKRISQLEQDLDLLKKKS